MIELRNVSKIFTEKTEVTSAVKNISLNITQGEILGVVGISGSGKSTLLKLLNLVEKPTSGDILLDGKNTNLFSKKEIRQQKAATAMIFQQFNLLHNLTVEENVALPLSLQGKKDPHKISELLAFAGLTELAKRYPIQLSGGQKQRVAIARALVLNPQLLLADEATSALDANSTQEILALLKKVHEKFQPTIIVVSHELEVVKNICQRAIILENGQQVGETTVVNSPEQASAENYAQLALRRLSS
ncbi:methionine ABC transporter ATP-binding protein [Enterococcus timonensis]|uniref:methionine ABC transporter ATP-binding protein n=1 Tax=Enterococcus timonensis TaxID=1852364 RepID=UPI0008D9D0AD|nr:ATP-binding cassette domain-containing protein [Enterococcus timonensis]